MIARNELIAPLVLVESVPPFPGKQIGEYEETSDIWHLPQSATCLAALSLRAVSN